MQNRESGKAMSATKEFRDSRVEWDKNMGIYNSHIKNKFIKMRNGKKYSNWNMKQKVKKKTEGPRYWLLKI